LVAAEFFANRGAAVLVLTGAQVVHSTSTPWAKAYGMCKAAVHHLALSVAAEKSSIPDRRVACLLPTMLDTPANRASMPDADVSKWTPLESVAKTVLELCKGSRVEGYDAARVFIKV
jgi:NAD(P)-dependent dehydrogenase (short-subunit alcohol dehydrogenase family)